MKEKSLLSTVATNSVFHVDQMYFKEIMVGLGKYLSERYRRVDVVPITELFSQIAYINDLTIQQKQYVSAWLASHEDYEGMILQFLNEDD